MNVKNLKRAAELYEMLNACTAVRESITESAKLSINGVDMPKEVKHNVIQAINLTINSIRDEVKGL